MGLLLSIYYTLGYFFVYYFISLGWADYGSALGLSLLLLVGGMMLFVRERLGNATIVGFIIGNIIDRGIIGVLYSSYVTWGTILIPITSSLIMAVVWYKNREVLELKNVYQLIVLILVVLIVVHPKLVEGPMWPW